MDPVERFEAILDKAEELRDADVVTEAEFSAWVAYIWEMLLAKARPN